MPPLKPSERRALRARAHALKPVVLVGHQGLTPAVLHEIDVALAAHELIKVRVFDDDREVRDALLARISADLDCAAVQHLGKILTVWRPKPPEEPVARVAARRDPGPSSPLPRRPGSRIRATRATPVADPVAPPASRRRRRAQP
jgi:putative YhbY family RNA-binding protein